MRVTIALLGFGLGAVMFAQAFLIYGLSSIASNSESSNAAQAGLGMVVLWLFASAFVFGVPWLSLALFLIAGAVGIANSEHFIDLKNWAVASLILAGLTAVQLWQNHNAKKISARTAGVVAAGAVRCPSCGTQFQPGDAFCSNCGAGLPAIPPLSAKTLQPKPRQHIPLALGFVLFALGQIFALGRDAGVVGYGNLFGLMFLIAFLGWMIYWVRKNGTGGIRLPASVLSRIRPGATNPSAWPSAAQPQFPFTLAVVVLIIAGVATAAISVVDTRYASIRVDGNGMVPALPEGSMWTVASDAYSSALPQRGDLILYADTNDKGQSVIRVIGLPGEHVVISDGNVQVDDVVLDEPYVDGSTRCSTGDTCDIVLADDDLFLLGDNRGDSKDSRKEGPAHLSDVRGEIVKPFLQLGFR